MSNTEAVGCGWTGAAGAGRPAPRARKASDWMVSSCTDPSVDIGRENRGRDRSRLLLVAANLSESIVDLMSKVGKCDFVKTPFGAKVLTPHSSCKHVYPIKN